MTLLVQTLWFPDDKRGAQVFGAEARSDDGHRVNASTLGGWDTMLTTILADKRRAMTSFLKRAPSMVCCPSCAAHDQRLYRLYANLVTTFDDKGERDDRPTGTLSFKLWCLGCTQPTQARDGIFARSAHHHLQALHHTHTLLRAHHRAILTPIDGFALLDEQGGTSANPPCSS